MTFGCGSDGRLGHPEVAKYVYLYREAFPREIEGLFKNNYIIDATSSYYFMAAIAEKWMNNGRIVIWLLKILKLEMVKAMQKLNYKFSITVLYMFIYSIFSQNKIFLNEFKQIVSFHY